MSQAADLEKDELTVWLKENGWVTSVADFSEDASTGRKRRWYKPFPGEPRCCENANKHLILRVVQYTYPGAHVSCASMDIRAGISRNFADPFWVSLEIDSLETPAQAEDACNVLLRAWRAAAT